MQGETHLCGDPCGTKGTGNMSLFRKQIKGEKLNLTLTHTQNKETPGGLSTWQGRGAGRGQNIKILKEVRK